MRTAMNTKLAICIMHAYCIQGDRSYVSDLATLVRIRREHRHGVRSYEVTMGGMES